jgi:hypothetical protein
MEEKGRFKKSDNGAHHTGRDNQPLGATEEVVDRFPTLTGY